MKILYISDHAVLEHDEIKLFTQMGHTVFSWGAYLNPHGHPDLPRPGIPEMTYFPHYEQLARTSSRTPLPEEMIRDFDVVILMHAPTVLETSWKLLHQKPTIWRSIGQSNRGIERMIEPMKRDGLKVVRYSPKEENIPDYAGADAMIRFYKDPEEFKDWNGNERRVVNFTQTLKGRRGFCHYEEIFEVIEHFNGKVYGSGNEDLGTFNGGKLPYEMFKQTLRDARVFIYGGSWPAPYTLAFIEAWMTGIPIVAIGPAMAHNRIEVPANDRFNFYEVHELIENGVNGFYSDDMEEVKKYVEKLLSSHETAQEISSAGRGSAIHHFGKMHIKEQWKDLFASL